MKVLPTLKADAVFLSPPWGGPEYQNVEVFDLHSMIPPPLSALEMFRAARAVTPNVVFFLPRNIDTAQIAGLPAAAAAADSAAAETARNPDTSQAVGLPAAAAAADTAKNIDAPLMAGLPAVAAAPAGALEAGASTALESTARVDGEEGVGDVALPKTIDTAQITGLSAAAAAARTGGLEAGKSAAVQPTAGVGGVVGATRVDEMCEVEEDGVGGLERIESITEECRVGGGKGFDETCEVEMQFLNGKLKTTTAYFGVDIAAVGKKKVAPVSNQEQTESSGSSSRDPSLVLDIASFKSSSRGRDSASRGGDICSGKSSSKGVGSAEEVSEGIGGWSGRHVRFSDDGDDKVGVAPEVDWNAPTPSGNTSGVPCPPSQKRETRENALYEAWIG